MFEYVQLVTGVPWEALAAVWYRESYSVALPKRPGGCFQFDPPTRTLEWKAEMLRRFTIGLTEKQREKLIATFGKDFTGDAIWAACVMRNNCKPVITPRASDAVVKDALYGYNGRAYGGVDRSPYVMNGFDAAHDDMRVKGTVRRADGSNEWVDVVDQKCGAFVVYKQLKALRG